MPCEETSIIKRFCYDEYLRQNTQTIGADFYMKRLTLPGKREVTVRITDIGGAELNGQMLGNYLFNTNMIILVYDITNSESFDGMLQWIDRMVKLLERPPFVAILGNKSDMEHKRAVRLDKTQSFVEEFQLLSFLVSAKTIIEKYTENVRFCIICNYLSKIIPALQSRCTRFRFGPLAPEQILPRLNYVVDEEKDNRRRQKALLDLASGDMRKILNVLQSTWLAYKNVTEENVYTCVGHPLRTDIESIVKWLLNDDFKTTYNRLALQDIIIEVHKFVNRIEFPFDLLIDILDKMAEIEYRLSTGANENIQLTALISIFQQVKDVTPPENT
ncbi:hypothetical protein NQ317_008671 [Molorchus minor]|uniref:Replication factor C C-terminal domain-containing protein n=1 Tax=Molorchus minor TaxID=1323400 RepID=A0ABQ9K0T5_9CUCU|nr:hypothetical protein NQ317_008671 [Molorchus minor]